jgi:hypothetical protein
MGCEAKQVAHKKVIDAANHILNRTEFDEQFFKSKVDSIEVMPKRRLVFHMKDGTSREFSWIESSRRESWTPEMKEQARIRALNQMKGRVQNG